MYIKIGIVGMQYVVDKLLKVIKAKLSGIDFLRIIREKSLIPIPILIVSAKDVEADKALGLGFGADDYIPKPFSMIELSARVKVDLCLGIT
ncbi:hypothetical protein PGLA_25875 [Paenibacillus glacialis]|uniref:Response regulatory domain-containing protein n=1 Tax=Paenibacillus glacialis TaxID=494026 RepID=A0A168BZH7_9BACL|nr:hypothetical protein PGLA_25875 [Paenibacillus glacialis]